MKGLPITIFGDGNQTRAFTYVKDISSIIANSPTNKKAYRETFDIGADKPYTINYLANCVAASMNSTASIKYLEPRDEVYNSFASYSKVRKYFACPIDTYLEIGLRKMADWAKETGIRKATLFSNIEIYENMPNFWRQFTIE